MSPGLSGRMDCRRDKHKQRYQESRQKGLISQERMAEVMVVRKDSKIKPTRIAGVRSNIKRGINNGIAVFCLGS